MMIGQWIDENEYIVIGAGAGLSAAAGFEYGGMTFMENFKYMHDLYGYRDMYTAGFHPFDSLEEFWGYWSKFIYLNRYKEKKAKSLYERLFELVKDKDYFVITTNVDHQFQKAGFDKDRLFYMQGDYGLFQCSDACHQKTYDNERQILDMMSHIHEHRIPTSLIPKCPVCGKPMTTNLRCDDYFVEDEGWHMAKRRYDSFQEKIRNKKVLYLELGVGYSTPVWIKYPFIRNTYLNKNATYVVIDKGYVDVPSQIEKQTHVLNGDISLYI